VPASLTAQGAAPADSGIQATTIIMRVNYFRWADGMQGAGLTDLRTHLVPIWEAEKKAGILQSYSLLINTTPASPNDWTFAIALGYKNYAAMDSLGPRTGAITLKHYGSADARTAANQARQKLRIPVSTKLVNNVTFSRP